MVPRSGNHLKWFLFSTVGVVRPTGIRPRAPCLCSTTLTVRLYPLTLLPSKTSTYVVKISVSYNCIKIIYVERLKNVVLWPNIVYELLLSNLTHEPSHLLPTYLRIYLFVHIFWLLYIKGLNIDSEGYYKDENSRRTEEDPTETNLKRSESSEEETGGSKGSVRLRLSDPFQWLDKKGCRGHFPQEETPDSP